MLDSEYTIYSYFDYKYKALFLNTKYSILIYIECFWPLRNNLLFIKLKIMLNLTIQNYNL